jgi:hypothetical protein
MDMHINEIIPESYKDRAFLKGMKRKRYENDPDPNHVLGTYTIHVPKVKEVHNATYDQFMTLLRKLYKAQAIKDNWPLINCLGKKTRIYMHEDNVNVIYDIVKCILETKNKGIMLVGAHGSGKSQFIDMLLKTNNLLSLTCDNLKIINTYKYHQIHDEARITCKIDHINNINKSVYIDDLCYQDRSIAKGYGNHDNIPDLIITRCYDLYKSGHRIIMTSNYGPDFMLESGFIHEGSADRLYEMMTKMIWSGDSLRKKTHDDII